MTNHWQHTAYEPYPGISPGGIGFIVFMHVAIIITAFTTYRIALYQELCRTGNAVTVLSMMHESKELRGGDLSHYYFNSWTKSSPALSFPEEPGYATLHKSWGNSRV
ncbi:MAG: hypothetical protein WCE43_03715 [Burkholderiales bacterium]